MLKPAQRVDVVRETPCGNLCQKKDGTIGQCLTRADPPNLLTNVRSTRAPIGKSCQHGRLRSQIKVRFEGHAEAWSGNIMRACRVRIGAYLEGSARPTAAEKPLRRWTDGDEKLTDLPHPPTSFTHLPCNRQVEFCNRHVVFCNRQVVTQT